MSADPSTTDGHADADAADPSPIPADGTLAFFFAMPIEAKPLVRTLGLQRGPVGAGDGWIGWLGGRRVLAVVSGMGTELAGAAARRLLDAEAVAVVVVVGISGGVDDTTPIGTVIHPEVVIDSATGVERRPLALGGPRAGGLWTTDVITPPAEVAALHRSGIVGLDMETAAVAAACEERGVAWTVVRSLSDGPADHVDDEVFAMSNQDGTPNPGRVLRYVVRHPGRIPALARMGRG
ncbi:MAG: hypothetical protein R2746_00190 [Acidimicrobiales bacterium]